MDTYAAADKRQEALRILEQLELQGDIRPDEKRILDTLRSGADADNRAVGETGAAYRGVAQGATLGAADEIGAGVRAVGGALGLREPVSYGDALTGIRNQNDQARRDFPDQYSSGKIAGGAMTSAIPLGGTIRAMQGAGLGAQTLAGMATGAGIAATEGFLSGEGGDGPTLDQFRNRARSAMEPVPLAIGAATGAVAPLAGRAVGHMVADARAPVGRPVADLGFDPQAARLATRSFGDDAAVSADIRSYLEGLGPEGMIADAGRNTRMQASGVTRVPGQAGQTITRRMDERAAETPDRIRATMDDVGGTVRNQAIDRATRQNFRDQFSSPLYEAAVKVETPLDTRQAIATIDQMIANRAPGAAQLKGIRDALEADPRPIVVHNLRSDLSDTAAEAARAGRNKAAATYSKALGDIDAALDTLPTYKMARANFADSKALDRAAEDGAAFLKPGVRSDQLAYDFPRLSEPEQEAFRRAARDALDLEMNRAVQEGNKAVNLIVPTENRAKMEIIFGPGSADKLAQRASAEKTFRETRQKATQGSETAANQAATREILPLVDDAGNRLGPIQRGRQAVSEPINQVVDALLRRPKGRALNDLAEILTSQGGQRDQLVSALLAAQGNNARNKAITSNVQAALQMLMQSGGAGLAVGARD